MAKPIRHGNEWRICRVDEAGRSIRQVFTDRTTAELAQPKAELEAEERRRGHRAPALEPRTFLDAAAYWRSPRAPQKRSQGDEFHAEVAHPFESHAQLIDGGAMRGAAMEAPRGELQSLASGRELAAGNALEIRGVHEWLSLGDADG